MFPRLYPEESRYLACTATHHVNLAGNEIVFQGIPWMQQDKLVAACASISIWVANRHLAKRFPDDFKKCTSARITKLATRTNPATGRGMPSDGLTGEQMVQALTALGYDPLYLETLPRDEANQICSQYIRSSIPIIAILTFPEGGHAVTLVGHTVGRKPTHDEEPEGTQQPEIHIHRFSDFIPRFIIQDDSGGPLRFLEFLSWEDATEQGYVSAEDQKTLKQRFASVVRLTPGVDAPVEIAYLTSILVPLPLRVTLKATHAHRNAMEITRDLLFNGVKLPKGSVVVDTFLRPSNDYKDWWTPLNGRPPDVAPLLRRHMLPHWIWISEVSVLGEAGQDGEAIGHILQDSSGRGTRDPLDDLIAVIGPRSIALALPDSTFVADSRIGSEPICRFREGELI
jgi:hypothetical protein